MTAETASCACHHETVAGPDPARRAATKRGLRLQYATVAWNIIEGIIAVSAALAAGSVALLGFGVDSFVECASALVMIWRLRADRNGDLSPAKLEAVEKRARKLIAASLFLLAAYVTFDAATSLWEKERPQFSIVGAVLMSLSVLIMLWLARAKRLVAQALNSEAMEADAFQTTACWWLSLTALAGLALNGLFGWWWADPVAGLVIAGLVANEGREAWKGRACC